MTERAAPEGAAPLAGVLVTDSRVGARGRSWPLGDIQRVFVARQPPRVAPLFACLALGVVLGLPLLSVALASTETPGRGFYEAALVSVSLLVFGSIARLLLAEDTYWLVLLTQRGEHRVFGSPERERVVQLASAVAEAMERQRR